ncbi:hypothetical protein [Streptomyces sp. S465]|uniref:hypothetical protein n=1 Tax=Streptomyces sp. S465 TaxID=2979468 RepID=UPI0022A88D4A|nr:hypothetical protein [Streptomyces sp. S465]WAP59165.1 hypothetical protein N6H00_31760 [Streptomyces sp. S465]
MIRYQPDGDTHRDEHGHDDDLQTGSVCSGVGGLDLGAQAAHGGRIASPRPSVGGGTGRCMREHGLDSQIVGSRARRCSRHRNPQNGGETPPDAFQIVLPPDGPTLTRPVAEVLLRMLTRHAGRAGSLQKAELSVVDDQDNQGPERCPNGQ